LDLNLDKLVESKFLRSHNIEKTSRDDGFNITFLPGRAFFEDYDAVYKRRTQPEIQFKFHEEHAAIGQPIELVRRFHELRTGQRITASHITAAEQTYATTLIQELGYESALAFVDYGVGRAQASNYAVNTLSGLKIYNADFRVARAALDRSHKQEARRARERHEDADRTAYAAYREQKAEEFLASASAALRLQIETEATARIRTEPEAPQVDPVAEIEARDDAGKLRQRRIELHHAAAGEEDPIGLRRPRAVEMTQIVAARRDGSPPIGHVSDNLSPGRSSRRATQCGATSAKGRSS
jgi:hypothetical protein